MKFYQLPIELDFNFCYKTNSKLCSFVNYSIYLKIIVNWGVDNLQDYKRLLFVSILYHFIQGLYITICLKNKWVRIYGNICIN